MTPAARPSRVRVAGVSEAVACVRPVWVTTLTAARHPSGPEPDRRRERRTERQQLARASDLCTANALRAFNATIAQNGTASAGSP